jgi:hypothetical protein
MYNIRYNNKRKVTTMSALTLSIPALLVGKHYRSRSRNDEGTILHAEKRDGIWYGEGFEAYAIQVSPTRGINDFWATVAVKVSD